MPNDDSVHMRAMAREFISVWSKACLAASATCIISATQVWQFPYPRSLFLQVGMWTLFAGLVLAYGAYSVLGERDVHTFNYRIFITMTIFSACLLGALFNLYYILPCVALTQGSA